MLSEKIRPPALIRIPTASGSLSLFPSTPEAKPKFVGIGLVLGVKDTEDIVIRLVTPNGPAAKSGALHEGDFLIAVDDKLTKGKSLKEVQSMIAGEMGSSVKLEIERRWPHVGRLAVTLTRAETEKLHDLPGTTVYYSHGSKLKQWLGVRSKRTASVNAAVLIVEKSSHGKRKTIDLLRCQLVTAPYDPNGSCIALREDINGEVQLHVLEFAALPDCHRWRAVLSQFCCSNFALLSPKVTVCSARVGFDTDSTGSRDSGSFSLRMRAAMMGIGQTF